MAIDKITTAAIEDANITTAKLAYEAAPFRNIIINGDMSICQRATSSSSISSSGSYQTVDRYNLQLDTAGTWTQSQSTDVPTGQGFAKSLKMDCTTANGSLSAGSLMYINQRFEGQNLQYLKKGTSSADNLTLSFWVKSNKTGTYIVQFLDTDNSRSISKSYTISSADTWEKKTLTFDGDTSGVLNNDNAESLRVIWWLVAGSTYSSGTLGTSWGSTVNANRAVGQVNLADSTSNEWYVTGIQLEAGTSASDFEFLPFDVNIDRCQRYFQKSFNYSNPPGHSDSNGMANGAGNTGSGSSTGQCINTTALVKNMRAAPTLVFYDAAGTSGKVYGIKYGVNEYNGQSASSFRVGSKYFAVERSSGDSIMTFSFHYTASSEL